MSVAKNVGFGLKMRGVSAAETASRVDRGAEARPAHRPGAQAAGAALGRPAAARGDRARDRHRAAADPDGRAAVQPRREAAPRDAREIRRIHRELDRATIYVTHDQDEALSLADRIVVMKDGASQQIATPQEVYAQPANLDVARFMGYRNVLELDGRAGGRRSRDAGRRRHPADRHCASSRSRTAAPASRSGPRRSSSATAGGANTLAGRVDNVEYCGRDSLVDVVTSDGTRLHVRTRGDGRPRRRGARRTCRSSARSSIPWADRWLALPRPRPRAPAARPVAAAGRPGRGVHAAAVRLSVPLRAAAVVQAREGRRARQLRALLHHRQPVADDLDDAAARAAGDAHQRRLALPIAFKMRRASRRTSAWSPRSSSCRSRSARC